MAVCVAHVLGVDPSEVPGDGGIVLRQWLAGRGLGLVPVASPGGFEWPGRFLGRRRGSETWAVFFGVPPGLVFDPAAGSDGRAEAELEAAFVLAEHEPVHGTGPGRDEGVGVVEVIALSAEAEGPMTVAPSAEAVAGRGLRGDRYERGAGTFSDPRGRGYDLTLVEAEALEELGSSSGVGIEPAEARRNLVVRGISLDGLIGKRFRVGNVECFGQRRCEPCAHLERLTRPGVLRGLVHRGGLRADVLSGGEIRAGDRVEAIEP
jgi:MOSC domain-containing protein